MNALLLSVLCLLNTGFSLAALMLAPFTDRLRVDAICPRLASPHRLRPGRPTVSLHVRPLIRTMSQANPLWGEPRMRRTAKAQNSKRPDGLSVGTGVQPIAPVPHGYGSSVR